MRVGSFVDNHSEIKYQACASEFHFLRFRARKRLHNAPDSTARSPAHRSQCASAASSTTTLKSNTRRAPANSISCDSELGSGSITLQIVPLDLPRIGHNARRQLRRQPL